MAGTERALLVLITLAGCPAAAPGPPIPAPREGPLAMFSAEAELRAYLAAAGRAREPRRVERGVISEAGGDRPYVHVEERTRPRVVYGGAPGVVAASDLVADKDIAWVTRERSIARAVLRPPGVPATADRIALPDSRDLQAVVARGLLALPDGVVAMVHQRCGGAGVDLARIPLDGEAVRICGRLVTEPVLVRVGSELVFYGAFDPIGDPPELVIPSVRLPGGPTRTLLELGPVHYPPERGADLLVRVVLRCSARLTDCRARSFVSARSAIDAVWIDDRRVALGFAHPHGRSFIVEQAHAGGAPRLARLDRWVIGLAGLSDGRLAIVRSSRAVPVPNERTIPLLAALDDRGRVVEGGALPEPVTGRDGAWSWAVRRDRLVYGPSRTHNLGGADAPRVVVAAIPHGPVDAQPISASVDAILFSGEDAIIVGATGKGVGTIAHRAIAGSGPWIEHAYGPPWSVDAPGFDQAGRAMLLELAGRRLIVVPFPDFTYAVMYRLLVLELGPSGVTELAKLEVPSASGAASASLADHDRLGATVLGGRLVLRAPGELVVLELTAGGAREVGRVRL